MNEKKLISTDQVQQAKTSVCWQQDRQMWRRVEGDEESRINDVQENP